MPDLDLSQPFTRREALAAGISEWSLRTRHQRVLTNVYVGPDVTVDTRVRALAALRLAPRGALVARHTAAELLGGVVPHSNQVHLLLPSGRLRAAGVATRAGTPRRAARMDGIPVTSAEDTFVDLARDLDLVDLVVLGDSLVARRHTSPEALVEEAARPGVRRAPARRAAGLVRTGVDSPMESRLRMLLILAGLPEPVVNHVEYDETGRWRRRFDLSYPEHRLAIEYDGRQHAADRSQWEHDIVRREGLDQDGWRLVVVLSTGIYSEPERTLQRVVAAMGQSGLPVPRLRSDWRRYFPGRT